MDHRLPEQCVAELRTATTPGQTFVFGVDSGKFPVSYSRAEREGYIIWDDPAEKERVMLFGEYRAERPLALDLAVEGTFQVRDGEPGADVRTSAQVASAASAAPIGSKPVPGPTSLVKGVKFSRTLTVVAEPKITASGLPKGLKVVSTAVKGKVGKKTKTVGYTCVLCGTPTQTGVYKVKFKQKVGKKTLVTKETFEVVALPMWAKGTFTGWAAADDGGDGSVGVASMTVSAAGKISGSLNVRGKKWTFTETGYDAAPTSEGGAFKVSVVAKNGKSRRNMSLAVSPDGFRRCSYADILGDRLVAEMRRTVWKDTPAKWRLLKEKFGLADLGLPRVKVSVSTSGKVLFAGKLPGGRTISSSSTAFVDEEGAFHAYLIVPWKGGSPGLLFDAVLSQGGQL